MIAENKGSDKETNPADASTTGSAPVAPTAASSPSPYRLLQAGAGFLLPHMTRSVVHVSGVEMLTVLSFRGQFVASTVYPPRLAAALDGISLGSILLVINPALDGTEGRGAAARGAARDAVADALREASAEPSPTGAPPLTSAVSLSDDGSCAPLDVVHAAGVGAIAPPLRAHYAMPRAADGALVFTPGERAFSGTHPLARALVCLWKGRARYNIMLDAEEAKGVEAVLKHAGYAPFA